jgi:peroxiredoxin
MGCPAAATFAIYPALHEVNVLALIPLLFGLASTPPDIRVGEAARLFSLPAINEAAAREMVSSSHVSLTDIVEGADKSGKGVVLFFFTQTKGGKDLQELNKLHKRFSRSGIRFLGISMDQTDLGALSDWVQSAEIEFPILRDNHRVVAERYSIKQLPMTVVIDATGHILSIGAPSGAQIGPEIEAELVPLLP